MLSLIFHRLNTQHFLAAFACDLFVVYVVVHAMHFGVLWLYRFAYEVSILGDQSFQGWVTWGVILFANRLKTINSKKKS